MTKESTQQSRRQILKGGALTLGTILVGNSLALKAEEVCQLTPPQTEGPFFPRSTQLDEDQDLTQIQGHRNHAQGEMVFIKGIVQDESCRPLSGALVILWQACASGRYNHPDDPNTASLDPHFQYWGKQLTNSKGEFFFKTIKPGSYPASDEWTRPPHIHYKIYHRGYKQLTTQMYFSGEFLNERDKILRALPPSERKNVIVDFQPEILPSGETLSVGQFKISLNKIS